MFMTSLERSVEVSTDTFYCEHNSQERLATVAPDRINKTSSAETQPADTMTIQEVNNPLTHRRLMNFAWNPQYFSVFMIFFFISPPVAHCLTL